MFKYRQYLVQGLIRRDNMAIRVSCTVKTRFKFRAIKLGRKYLRTKLQLGDALVINKTPIALKDGEVLA